ncbi:coproporphyrinogen-III oxidase family protein [Campylobacter coli]
MHLYIHIPFCESKCHYCAFTSLKKHDYENRYFEALYEDISFHLQKLNIKKNSIKTLFIGGGTPSAVSAKNFEMILTLLEPFLSKNIEFSSEANPNSADIEWLKAMKNLGLNRISFGAQSFHPKKLEFLGRIHDQKMLEFELEQLKQIKNLITHLSAYNLTIEPLSAFAKKEHFKKNAPYLMKFFIQELQNLGFLQYEISNFAKNNAQICKHNLAYWKGLDYLGCGLSAVSCYKNERFYTAKNLKSYLQNPIFRDVEKLNQEDLNLEHLFLGLRSIVGIKECKLSKIQKEKANLLVREKKLKFEKGRYYNLNFLISDELALYLSS